VAGHLAAGLFAYLAVDPPGVIIIAGPDHFNRGPPVGTSRASWQTAGGLVEPHLETIDGLIEAGLAREVRAVLEGEHSVGALMPLIKLYLPRARVVPLTLRGDVTFEQAAALGRHLAVAFSAPSRGAGGPTERIVFVASVDFSHYLPKGEADARDALTLGALERGEWGALFAFGPHHLDSAASLAAAFAFAGYLDDPRFRMIAHINSATVLGRPGLQETTSYLLLTIP
jgi:AmmeMemoRadiSam system protein B